MTAVPSSVRFVVVGAGVHGLSTALHLAEAGAGGDVLVVDKAWPGAGASGISGGIVRNFYRSAPVNEIVRQSVEIFELDPQLFGFRQVGYVAVVPESQADDLERIAEQHAAIGYPSTLVRGADEVSRHMRGLFPDWRATGSTALLHEHASGWADATTTVASLAGMARAGGVRIAEGVRVTGLDDGGATVETTAGTIHCEAVVLAPGPWARELWALLGLPAELDVAGERRPAFHYWQVQEGELAHPTASFGPDDPVVHLDADVALPGADGAPLLQPPWGVYFRPGIGGGVAIGGLPNPLPGDCALDPYGPSHPVDGATAPGFEHTMAASLAWAFERFGGPAEGWSSTAGSSPTCFTPDSYPVTGFVAQHAYALLDSNHGFKMLALGKLAARELLGGHAPELDPFRLERFAAAALHPVSASPYPWT